MYQSLPPCLPFRLAQCKKNRFFQGSRIVTEKDIMKKSMLSWLCFLLCFAWFDPATAANHRNDQYLLTQHVLNGHTTLRLFNRANGRTVWRKQVAELDCIGWSPDHKALAVSARIVGKTPFRLLLWQEGRPLRLLDDSPLPEGGYIDGVIDFAWSPDDRRVTHCVYGSGNIV